MLRNDKNRGFKTFIETIPWLLLVKGLCITYCNHIFLKRHIGLLTNTSTKHTGYKYKTWCFNCIKMKYYCQIKCVLCHHWIANSIFRNFNFSFWFLWLFWPKSSILYLFIICLCLYIIISQWNSSILITSISFLRTCLCNLRYWSLCKLCCLLFFVYFLVI